MKEGLKGRICSQIRATLEVSAFEMEMLAGGPFGAGGGAGVGGGATGGAAAGAIPNCPKPAACGLLAEVGVWGTDCGCWGTNTLGVCTCVRDQQSAKLTMVSFPEHTVR